MLPQGAWFRAAAVSEKERMGAGKSRGRQPDRRQEAWEEGEEARGGSSRKESKGRGSQDGGTAGPGCHPGVAAVIALVMWKELDLRDI